MATVDLTRGGALGGLNADGLDPISVVRRRVDFSEITTGAGTGGVATASDVLQLFHIPAGYLVDRVYYRVVTAEGATFTFDVGDGSDADGYIDGANGNSAGSGVSTLALTEGTPNTVTGYSNGKYYSATDTVDLTVATGTDVDTAVVEIALVLVALAKTDTLI